MAHPLRNHPSWPSRMRQKRLERRISKSRNDPLGRVFGRWGRNSRNDMWVVDEHFGPGGSEELKVLLLLLEVNIINLYIKKQLFIYNNMYVCIYIYIYIFIENNKKKTRFGGMFGFVVHFFCTGMPRRYKRHHGRYCQTGWLFAAKPTYFGLIDTAWVGGQALWFMSVLSRMLEHIGSSFYQLFGVNISELIHALLPLAVLQVLPISINEMLAEKRHNIQHPKKKHGSVTNC